MKITYYLIRSFEVDGSIVYFDLRLEKALNVERLAKFYQSESAEINNDLENAFIASWQKLADSEKWSVFLQDGETGELTPINDVEPL